jgi:hypothetical protein
MLFLLNGWLMVPAAAKALLKKIEVIEEWFISL